MSPSREDYQLHLETAVVPQHPTRTLDFLFGVSKGKAKKEQMLIDSYKTSNIQDF
jgi:hypothetical protein